MISSLPCAIGAASPTTRIPNSNLNRPFKKARSTRPSPFLLIALHGGGSSLAAAPIRCF
jgi:hypothetical protein